MSNARRAQVAEEARERYAQGCNCAQSVISALAGLPGMPALPPAVGAGFTTGIGHNGCVCGALAGGTAVLGEYAARQGLEPIATQQLAEELSSALYQRFTGRFGSACCRVIKRGATEGSDGWLSTCAGLTEETAQMVADIVAEHQAATAERARWAARDVMSVARRVVLDVLAGGAIGLAVSAVVPAQAAPAVFGAVVVLGALAGLALELGGAGSRRAGRVLRAAGVTAAAVLTAVAVFLPTTAEALLETATDAAPALLPARVLLALSVLAVAASSLVTLKRYR